MLLYYIECILQIIKLNNLINIFQYVMCCWNINSFTDIIYIYIYIYIIIIIKTSQIMIFLNPVTNRLHTRSSTQSSLSIPIK